MARRPDIERNPYPPWTVLLIGGASGVGKTMVSYRLARHYGIGMTEIDDFQVVLERMTTPQQYPLLHFFPQHPEAFLRLDDEQKLAFAVGFAHLMAVALEAVIANHLESGTPLVLEGDFMPPSLAVQPLYGNVPAADRVRAIFIYEADEQQIGRNFLAREGEWQPIRSRASWYYSEWLRQEATRLRVPAVAARPWETVLERCIAAVDSMNPSRATSGAGWSQAR